MDSIVTTMLNGFADGRLMLMLLIFAAAVTRAFAVMLTINTRKSVKRRTSRIGDGSRQGEEGRSLRHNSRKAVTQLIEYTTKHYAAGNDSSMRLLRQRLIQAGIYDARGVAFFFLGRTGLAILLGLVAFLAIPMLSLHGSGGWLMVIVGGIAGYIGPSMYIDKRISARREEHRAGFPDFLDLLVVCADSGLSMEAALERVGRELGESYPSLSANVHMTNLEIRDGRNLKFVLVLFVV